MGKKGEERSGGGVGVEEMEEKAPQCSTLQGVLQNTIECRVHYAIFFYVLLTVQHLSIFLIINQLNAQNIIL